jgi:hypothetical protein
MLEVTRLDATRLEMSASSSSSEDSSGGGYSEDVEAKIEKVVVVDPRESVRSYDFGLSTVTVGRIQQLEALRYFTEGSTREPGEETVVFEEFFAAGLWMPPHPALTEILLKYRVQLHQLTPNAFVQLSKYFWVVLSLGGVPSSDGFTRRYELHYQPKKVVVDSFEKYQQFSVINSM